MDWLVALLALAVTVSVTVFLLGLALAAFRTWRSRPARLTDVSGLPDTGGPPID